MAKARFFIKNSVQEVGYRVSVMERLLETNLKGGVINMQDGRVKVLVEGEKGEILKFVERLKEAKPELAKNPKMTAPEFDAGLTVPDEIRLSHSLQMNQFGKAVVYLAKMDNKMDLLVNGNKKLDKLDKLGGMEKRLGKLDGIESKLGKLDEIAEGNKIIIKTLESLPERIAVAIKKPN